MTIRATGRNLLVAGVLPSVAFGAARLVGRPADTAIPPEQVLGATDEVADPRVRGSLS